ncbi:DUF11 domain-containing protein, partial [Winogradskyella eckloniae]|uniref:DUF7507 domain-containing protein n=1 Tax=Winogradskyella eckloniae TaxID=1089306 RepID=UPI001565F9F3
SGTNPIASLASGASATFVVRQTITATDIANGYLENSASATGDSPSGTDDVSDDSDTDVDPNGNAIPNNETVDSPDGDGTDDMDPTNDPTVTNLDDNPELTVTKTTDGTITSAGVAGLLEDTIDYTITVTNTGNVTLTNVEVTDADVTFISGTNPIASLASGASATFVVRQTITATDIANGYLENSASATGDSPSGTDDVSDDSDTDVDPNGNAIPNNETVDSPDGDGTDDMDPTNDPTVTNLDDNPELTVTKTTDGTITSAGVAGLLEDTIDYTITVTNTGNVTLTNVEVTDADVTFISGTNPIASLASGASATFVVRQTITATDIANGYLENSASATGDSPSGTDDVSDDSDTDVDPNGNAIPNNETVDSPDGDGTDDMDPTNDPTVTNLDDNPELTVTKTTDGTITSAGVAGLLEDTIDYTITVTNTGNVTLTNVEVTDADVTFISGTNPIASLASGASATFVVRQTITATDIANGYLENSASATGDSPSGTDDVSDDSDTDVDPNGNAIPNNETVDSPDGDGTDDMDP